MFLLPNSTRKQNFHLLSALRNFLKYNFEVALLKYLSFIGLRADIYATSSRHFNFRFNFRHQRRYIKQTQCGSIVIIQTKTGGASEVNKIVNAVGENCGFKKGKLCLEKFWPIRARGEGV